MDYHCLHCACSSYFRVKDRLQIIDDLIDTFGFPLTLESDDEFKHQCIHIASGNSHPSIVHALLLIDPELAEVTNTRGMTPLMYACWNITKSKKDESDVLEMVRILIEEYNVDITRCDNDGWNAVHYACNNKVSTLRIIKELECEAESTKNVSLVTATTYHGFTALMFACKNDLWDDRVCDESGVIEMVSELVNQYKIDLYASDIDGNTCLHYACTKSNSPNLVIKLCTLETQIRNKRKVDKSKPLLIQRINHKQQTPFGALCASGNRYTKFSTTILSFLLHEYPKLINPWKVNGDAQIKGGPLNAIQIMCIAEQGDSKTVMDVLNQHDNMNEWMCTNNKGYTLLMHVCGKSLYVSDWIEVMHTLVLQCGMPLVCINDNDGWNVFHWVCGRGSALMCDSLLSTTLELEESSVNHTVRYLWNARNQIGTIPVYHLCYRPDLTLDHEKEWCAVLHRCVSEFGCEVGDWMHPKALEDARQNGYHKLVSFLTDTQSANMIYNDSRSELTNLL